MSELERKQEQIISVLDQHGLDGLYLRRVSSFAWATCGASSYVNTAASEGAAQLFITRQGRYLITNNIEAPRLEQEEHLAAQGWEFIVSEWQTPSDALAKLTIGLNLGADFPQPGMLDLSAQIARQRADLTPEEGDRLRILGHGCAQAMDAAIRAVKPGMSEYQIAGLLEHECRQRHIQAIVNLIAVDERIFKFRHPLPTTRVLQRYAMLVLCGRQGGLVCSITRLVHFGLPSAEIRSKIQSVARIDAELIASTRPGRTLADLFAHTMAMYAATGYADEWKLHHQGGPAGFEPREYLATPGSADRVKAGQAYAWNPSITGTKSEDTILVGQVGNEILTAIPGWPELAIQVGQQTVLRPDILIIE
jgi:antitoxin VapB